MNVERLSVGIEAECERQKSEIDVHLSLAQNEVKTLCNVLRNSIDTQESTLMLNISQVSPLDYCNFLTKYCYIHVQSTLINTNTRGP